MTEMNTKVTEIESLKIQNLALKRQAIESELNKLLEGIYRRMGIPESDFAKFVVDTNKMEVIHVPGAKSDAPQE